MRPKRIAALLFLFAGLTGCMHIENHIYAEGSARVYIGSQEQNKPVDVTSDATVPISAIP